MTIIKSGYAQCACRDCMDVAIANNLDLSSLCNDCEDAGCIDSGDHECSRCNEGNCSHDSCNEVGQNE